MAIVIIRESGFGGTAGYGMARCGEFGYGKVGRGPLTAGKGDLRVALFLWGNELASTVTVKVEGLRELGDRLKTLNSDMVTRIARAATAAGAAVIRDAAKQNVPVDSGNLKRNIIVKRLPKGESDGLTSEHIATVRRGKLTKTQKKDGLKTAYYGSFVEFGTVKMPARPFLRPAYDQHKEQAVKAIKSRIEARLKKANA